MSLWKGSSSEKKARLCGFQNFLYPFWKISELKVFIAGAASISKIRFIPSRRNLRKKCLSILKNPTLGENIYLTPPQLIQRDSKRNQTRMLSLLWGEKWRER